MAFCDINYIRIIRESCLKDGGRTCSPQICFKPPGVHRLYLTLTMYTPVPDQLENLLILVPSEQGATRRPHPFPWKG